MPNPPQDVIEATFGTFLWGMMIQQLLLGVVCVQIFDYYRTFPKDTIFHKSLVGLLAVLNVFLGGTNFNVLYRASVSHYGDFDGFDLTDWTSWLEPVVTATIGLLAQIYFLERCYRATKSWPVMSVLILMVIVSFGFGIYGTVSFAGVQRLSHADLMIVPTTGWLTTTAVTDLSIAMVLIITLIRSKTPFKKTERVINGIVRLSMETSFTTALVAIVNLILYYAIPKTAYHMIPQLSMCRVYTSTVMVTLASRVEMRSILFGDGHSSYVTREVVTADDKKIHNIKVTTTVTQESARSWQDTADIELAQTDSKFRPDDVETAFGGSKTEVL